jgi:hypothetical protein
MEDSFKKTFLRRIRKPGNHAAIMPIHNSSTGLHEELFRSFLSSSEIQIENLSYSTKVLADLLV